MAKRRKNDSVPFIAEYEDGSKECFDIDVTTLRSGDHMAIAIAFEKQKAGHLKAGRIVRARRDWQSFYER